MSNSVLFETSNLSIYQNNRNGQIVLKYFDDEILFRLCEFFSFKKKLGEIDIMNFLDSSSVDVEVLYLCHCDRFLLLDIHQLIELKDLFFGAHFTMELNSLIHSQLIRKPVSI